MSDTKVTITLDKFDSMRKAGEELSARVAQLQEELIAAKKEAISGSSEKLDEILSLWRASMQVASYALANLMPSMSRGWPFNALRAMAAGIRKLPDVTPFEFELATEYEKFAGECEEWERHRRVNPDRYVPPPAPKADDPEPIKAIKRKIIEMEDNGLKAIDAKILAAGHSLTPPKASPGGKLPEVPTTVQSLSRATQPLVAGPNVMLPQEPVETVLDWKAPTFDESDVKRAHDALSLLRQRLIDEKIEYGFTTFPLDAFNLLIDEILIQLPTFEAIEIRFHRIDERAPYLLHVPGEPRRSCSLEQTIIDVKAALRGVRQMPRVGERAVPDVEDLNRESDSPASLR
jgi:hypothetical protein